MLSWPLRCLLSPALCAYGFNSYPVRANKGSRKASRFILLFLRHPPPVSFSQQTESSRPVKCVFIDLVKHGRVSLSQFRENCAERTLQRNPSRQDRHCFRAGTFLLCLIFEFCIGRGVLIIFLMEMGRVT